MGSFNRPPDFMDEFQSLQRRLSQLETIAMQTLTDDSWQDVTFTPGYSNISGGQPASVAKDQNGQVHLRGAISASGLTTAGTIFTIPEPFRPTEATAVSFPVTMTNNSAAVIAAYVTVNSTTGAVVVNWSGGGTALFVFLGHQTYR